MASDSISCQPRVLCPVTCPSQAVCVCSRCLSPEVGLQLRGRTALQMGTGNAETQAQFWILRTRTLWVFSASFLVIHKEGREHPLWEMNLPLTRWILLLVDNDGRRGSAESHFCLKTAALSFSQQICFPRALGLKQRGKSPCLLAFVFCHTILLLNASQHLFFESGSWFLELFSHQNLTIE